MAFDIALKQGNSKPVSYAFKNADGSAFDFTGSHLYFFAEKSDGTLMTKTTAGDTPTLTMATPTNGVVSWEFTPAETRLFSLGRDSEWELEWRIDGKEYTILEGHIVVSKGLNADAE